MKVATGYVEITAEVTEVSKQVKSALDDASTLGKDAGKKIGENITAGVQSGTDGKTTGKKISEDITTGADAKTTGKKIGKEVSAGVEAGADAKNTGNKIGQDLTTGITTKLKDVTAATQKTTGEIKGLFGDINTAVSTVQSSTNTVTNSMNTLRDSANNVKGAVGGIGDATKALQSGDVAGSVKGFGDSFTGITNTIGTVQTAFNDIKGSLAAIPGLSKLASSALIADLGAVSVVAIPLAAAMGVIAYGWNKGLQQGRNVPGPGGGTMGGLGQGAPGGAPWPGPSDQGYTGSINNSNPAGVPPTPGPPPAGTSWQMGPNGNWVAVPFGQQPPGLGGTAGAVGAPPAAGLLSWNQLDSVATQFGLTVTSGYRDPNGPTIAGVPASASYHGSGRAHDYGGSPQARLAFANYMATNYGSSLKELIYDAPGFGSTIKDGQVVGPFGSFYTMGQAGDHSDHVHVAFDDGGWLPPGDTLATNNTGQPELILNPEQIKNVSQNPDLLKTVDQANGVTPEQGKQAAEAIDFMRSAGFIPSGAGSTSVAGTSFIAGLLNLGNEAVGGLIDTGASAAMMAIEAGIAAGGVTAPAAPAAGAAAGIGIQLAASEAKRAVSYGFQMGAIGADALIEILSPFGAPRWAGYDYSQFLPNISVGAIGTTTVEKAFQAAAAERQKNVAPGPGQQPGGPVTPSLLPGAQPPGPSVPRFGSMAPPQPAPSAPPGQPMGPPAGPAPAPAPSVPAAPAAPVNPMDWLRQEILGPRPATPPVMTALPSMDEGGWWPSGLPAINTTGRPELVLSPDQIAAANAAPLAGRGPLVTIGSINGMNPDDVANKIEAKQRLAIMRYSGRPYG